MTAPMVRVLYLGLTGWIEHRFTLAGFAQVRSKIEAKEYAFFWLEGDLA